MELLFHGIHPLISLKRFRRFLEDGRLGDHEIFKVDVLVGLTTTLAGVVSNITQALPHLTLQHFHVALSSQKLCKESLCHVRGRWWWIGVLLSGIATPNPGAITSGTTSVHCLHIPTIVVIG
jgi:hypothetical protein